MPLRTARCTASLLICVTLIALSGCSSNDHVVCPGVGCCSSNSDACVAPQYVLANGPNQVSLFSVDPSSGALGSPTTVTGPAQSLGMAVLDNQFVYVSDSGLSAPTAIDGWSLNIGTGALSNVPGSPFALGPLSLGTGLAASTTAQTLYVADFLQIDALKADATGALTVVPGSPYPSGNNLFLTTDISGQFLFPSENDPPGSIGAFTTDPTTGALTQVAGSPFQIDPSVPDVHPESIVVDSSGQFVYVVLVTSGQIAGFSISRPSGTLTQIPGSPFTAGTTPLAVISAGRYLYVSNASDRTLSGYSVDPSSGVLTELAGSPFSINTGALAANTSGTYLYASVADEITTFRIDGTTGALTQVSSTPFSGASVLTFVQ